MEVARVFIVLSKSDQLARHRASPRLLGLSLSWPEWVNLPYPHRLIAPPHHPRIRLAG